MSRVKSGTVTHARHKKIGENFSLEDALKAIMEEEAILFEQQLKL